MNHYNKILKKYPENFEEMTIRVREGERLYEIQGDYASVLDNFEGGILGLAHCLELYMDSRHSFRRGE